MKVHKAGTMLIMSDLILAAIGSVVVLTIIFATFPNEPDSVIGVGSQLHISSISGVNIGASLIRLPGESRIYTDDTESKKPIYFRKPTKPSGSKISVMFDSSADYTEETLFIYISDLKKYDIKKEIKLKFLLRGPSVFRESKMTLNDKQHVLKVKFSDLKKVKGISKKDAGWLSFFCKHKFRSPIIENCVGKNDQ